MMGFTIFLTLIGGVVVFEKLGHYMKNMMSRQRRTFWYVLFSVTVISLILGVVGFYVESALVKIFQSLGWLCTLVYSLKYLERVYSDEAIIRLKAKKERDVQDFFLKQFGMPIFAKKKDRVTGRWVPFYVNDGFSALVDDVETFLEVGDEMFGPELHEEYQNGDDIAFANPGKTYHHWANLPDGSGRLQFGKQYFKDHDTLYGWAVIVINDDKTALL